MRLGWVSVVVLAIGVAACGDSHGVDDPCGEPAYGGEATDEAWMSVVDAYELAVTGHADAASVAIPGAGEVLTGEAPATFSWTSPLAVVDCPGACGPAGGYRLPLWFDEAELVLSRAVLAHLPPISGDLHYAEVVVPGRECAIRMLTTAESWRPQVDEWEAMRGAGTLSFIVTSVYLEKNRIIEGPYRTTTTFEVR